MKKSGRNRLSGLKSGRPPLIANSSSNTGTTSTTTSSINARRKSAKATRKLINNHHQLQKHRAAAIAANDHDLVRELEDQIKKLGGLSAYQAASLTGQDRDRGGDSSEKLVEWLQQYGLGGKQGIWEGKGLRVLEIGALSSKNAISRMIDKGIESVRRVDLHSQEPDTIEQIDFMDLPTPMLDEDKFDLISLSLVLNYVPNATRRGDMLQRTTHFLQHSSKTGSGTEGDQIALVPCIFVVLPLSCLSNSRYMTHEHFDLIMSHLGYKLIQRYDSQKLAYMLFQLEASPDEKGRPSIISKKTELRSGKDRNNFAVVLKDE